MNFALRYQLAFSTYALALMSTRTPAYRAPYAEAMRAGIEKMLHPAVWSYWRAPESSAGIASSGHVAVLLSPHQRTVPGGPSDPVARDNVQYSGHLSTMLGLYEKMSGDARYDTPFTLHDPESGATFTYTHTEVAERIYSQMRENRFGGVCCEPGMAYVPCNNYAMASNTLHDALHSTRYSEANEGWLQTVRRKMVLHGPSVRGVFGTAYMKDLKLATPIAFNFTDAWGLAFLIPFSRPLARKLYRKFRGKINREDGDASVGSSPVSERMEISDVAINTGFGLILARGIGDEKLAAAMQRYARREFGAGWDGTAYLYRDAPRTIHSTALYAFAEALDVGGANFTKLFAGAADKNLKGPYLADVLDPSGRVGVSRAEYDAGTGTLHIGLRQVGTPSQTRSVPVRLLLSGADMGSRIEVNGQQHHPESAKWEIGSLSIEVDVSPSGETTVRVMTAA
jgi:hypothetical protein